MITQEEPDMLAAGEIYWRDRYDWLKGAGYTLRPRYEPKWEPSWRRTGKSRFQCEDGIRLTVGSATQTSVRYFCLLTYNHSLKRFWTPSVRRMDKS